MAGGVIKMPRDHMQDAMAYVNLIKARNNAAQAAAGVSAPQPQFIQHFHTAADCSTPDMIMELLKRGYAVIKMPEDGSLPETLK